MHPTPEQIAAVMSELGRRSGRKPKAGRFGTLEAAQQAATSRKGGLASAAVRRARRAAESDYGAS